MIATLVCEQGTDSQNGKDDESFKHHESNAMPVHCTCLVGLKFLADLNPYNSYHLNMKRIQTEAKGRPKLKAQVIVFSADKQEGGIIICWSGSSLQV